MKVSMIVAASENGVIGKDNQLIWRLPNDLKRFKQLTLGHPIIMGRKTFESIGKPLPGRTSIVITRQKESVIDGAIVVHSLKEALVTAAQLEQEEAFIIGGGEIYKESVKVADKIYLTLVCAEVAGDTYFDLSILNHWDQTSLEYFVKDERHSYSYKFIDLVKQS